MRRSTVLLMILRLRLPAFRKTCVPRRRCRRLMSLRRFYRVRRRPQTTVTVGCRAGDFGSRLRDLKIRRCDKWRHFQTPWYSFIRAAAGVLLSIKDYEVRMRNLKMRRSWSSLPRVTSLFALSHLSPTTSLSTLSN